MTTPKRLFLIDGMALIYRAHFALIKNPLLTADGRHTSAIYGFMNSLFKLLREEDPDYISIVLDCKEPTFRHEIYTDYKATREKMPQELVEQLEPLYSVIEATKIPMIKLPGYEADDIMGTLAKKAEKESLHTYIVTGDKDMMQLVNDSTFVYTPGNRFKPTTIYDSKKVSKKWGIGPDGIIDLLALMGDTSDNVPGIDGVGPKTAVKILNEYGTIEAALDNAEHIKNKRAREGMLNGKDLVHLSKELVTIKCDVPVDFHLEQLLRQSMDAQVLTEKFEDLELYSLIQHATKFSDDIIEFDTPDKNYKICTSLVELDTVIPILKNSNLISFDLETTSVNALEADIVGLSFSVKENEGWYIPIIYPEKATSLFDDFNLKVVLDNLKPLFEDPQIYFCGQNLKYDALVLSRYDISLNGIVFDSMIAEHLLHPEKNSYKLDYLALDYLNYRMKPIDDLIGKGTKQISMAEVPLEDISFYATEDADVTLQVVRKQKPIISTESLSNPFEHIEMPLLPVLITMESNGVYLDLNFLKKLSAILGEKLDTLITKIHSMAGHEFNINSPQQLAVVLFDELELKPIRKRSTAVEVLEVLKNHHPLPEYILEYRHLAKLKNTYIDSFPGYVHPKTGRVHTSLNQTIAATGRLSSANPNFQNIPIRTETGREIRKAFTVQNPEHVMLSADYSQIELRIMADFSQEPALIEAFNHGIDIHTRTAALVFSIDESLVTADQRRTAKVVNFGIMYGAGPFRMSQELGISMAEARDLINTYFNSYPGIREYMDNTLASAHEKGFVKTRLGRRRKMTQLKSGNHNLVKAEERAAINMPIQGTAADLIKIAMINIHKKMNDGNYSSKMILQIHDELLFEGPPEEMDKLSKLVVDEMEGAMSLSVPLKVDWKIGKNWHEAH